MVVVLCGLRTKLGLSDVETQRANFSFGIFEVVMVELRIVRFGGHHFLTGSKVFFASAVWLRQVWLDQAGGPGVQEERGLTVYRGYAAFSLLRLGKLDGAQDDVTAKLLPTCYLRYLLT